MDDDAESTPTGRWQAWAKRIKGIYEEILFRLMLLRTGGHAIMHVGGVRARFRVDCRAEARRVWYLSGEKALLAMVLARINPGEVVYDIGGNIGTHAMAFAIRVGPTGHVVSFEANPATADQLRRNAQSNRLSNVTVVDKALGERTGACVLYVEARSGSGRHSLLEAPDRVQTPVEMVQGDQWVAQEQLPVANVVKIDVEGAECGVIAGLGRTLRNPACRLIWCEVHPALLARREQTPEMVEQSLAAAGFGSFERFPRGGQYHLLGVKAG